MVEIKVIQNEFFEMIKSIQEESVAVALNEYNQGDKLEDLLYNATYEVICDICAMIDGYKNTKLSLDLIDNKSKLSIKSGIQLHDKCAEYIKFKELEL